SFWLIGSKITRPAVTGMPSLCVTFPLTGNSVWLPQPLATNRARQTTSTGRSIPGLQHGQKATALEIRQSLAVAAIGQESQYGAVGHVGQSARGAVEEHDLADPGMNAAELAVVGISYRPRQGEERAGNAQRRIRSITVVQRGVLVVAIRAE